MAQSLAMSRSNNGPTHLAASGHHHPTTFTAPLGSHGRVQRRPSSSSPINPALRDEMKSASPRPGHKRVGSHSERASQGSRGSPRPSSKSSSPAPISRHNSGKKEVPAVVIQNPGSDDEQVNPPEIVNINTTQESGAMSRPPSNLPAFSSSELGPANGAGDSVRAPSECASEYNDSTGGERWDPTAERPVVENSP